MPRRARLDIPGALHHVMIRSIERRDLFADDHDRQQFLNKLGEYVLATGSSVYAWALMRNHVHLLLRSGPSGMPAVLRKLLTWYALYFNKRHRRTGHLFQNRYKSILCEEEPYFLSLVRYIHLNPLRVGAVHDLRSLDHYRWCGHAVLMAHRSAAFMDTGYVLRQFGKAEPYARRAYRRFVAAGVTAGRNPELVGGGLVRSMGGWSQVRAVRQSKERIRGDERILGSSAFVLQVLSEITVQQKRQLHSPRAEVSIMKLVNEECRKGHATTVELESGSKRRGVCAVREAVVLRCARELGLSAAEIARHVGVNTSAVTRALSRAVRKTEQLTCKEH